MSDVLGGSDRHQGRVHVPAVRGGGLGDVTPQLAEDLEAVLLLLREEGEQAQLDRALLQLRGPLGGDFRHQTRLVSETRYMAVRGATGSGGRTSFTRCVEVVDVMIESSCGGGKERERGRRRAAHFGVRRARVRRYSAGTRATPTTATWISRMPNGVR